MHTGFDNKLIYLCDHIEAFLVHTGNDLLDGFEPMYLITGVDTLGRIADFKIDAAL